MQELATWNSKEALGLENLLSVTGGKGNQAKGQKHMEREGVVGERPTSSSKGRRAGSPALTAQLLSRDHKVVQGSEAG